MGVLGPDRPRVPDRIGLAGEEPLHVAGGDVQLTEEDRHHRGVVLAEPVSRQGEALDDRWVVAAVVREIGVVLDALESEAQLGQEQADLVRVARRGVVVEAKHASFPSTAVGTRRTPGIRAILVAVGLLAVVGTSFMVAHNNQSLVTLLTPDATAAVKR